MAMLQSVGCTAAPGRLDRSENRVNWTRGVGAGGNKTVAGREGKRGGRGESEQLRSELAGRCAAMY